MMLVARQQVASDCRSVEETQGCCWTPPAATLRRPEDSATTARDGRHATGGTGGAYGRRQHLRRHLRQALVEPHLRAVSPSAIQDCTVTPQKRGPGLQHLHDRAQGGQGGGVPLRTRANGDAAHRRAVKGPVWRGEVVGGVERVIELSDGHVAGQGSDLTSVTASAR